MLSLLKKLSLLLCFCLFFTNTASSNAQQVGKPANNAAKSKVTLPTLPGMAKQSKAPNMKHHTLYTPPPKQPEPPKKPTVKLGPPEKPKTELQLKLEKMGIDVEAMQKAAFKTLPEAE